MNFQYNKGEFIEIFGNNSQIIDEIYKINSNSITNNLFKTNFPFFIEIVIKIIIIVHYEKANLHLT